MNPICPPPSGASAYHIALCIQKTSNPDFSHVWSPENGGNVPSPTPTPPNQNVANGLDNISDTILLIGGAILLLFLLYIIISTYGKAKGVHRY